MGHAVDVVFDGEKGLTYALKEPYDVIVLDIMLPKLDGLSILTKLRAKDRDVPVLLLTAKDTVEDRVRGLQSGADDYLIKPFAFEELNARLDALLRRRQGIAKSLMQIGDLTIDTAARQVTRGTRKIRLLAREYDLLLLLASRRGQLVSRIEIEDHRYGERNFPRSNAVAVSISKLRSLLCAEGEPDMIETRRNLGYVLDAPSP
jgi:DNA-binding response OmpR family regulator